MNKGGLERVLKTVLGKLEVPERPDQAGEETAPVVPGDLLDRLDDGNHLPFVAHARSMVQIGRTSTLPMAACGIIAA